jgi:hypothetical protein
MPQTCRHLKTCDLLKTDLQPQQQCRKPGHSE